MLAVTVSIPALEYSDERWPQGLSPNIPIHEYQDAEHYSAAVFREAKLLRYQQDQRSEYLIFTNLNQERFSRDFQDPTDWTSFEWFIFARRFSW